jgi:hypothetical protein
MSAIGLMAYEMEMGKQATRLVNILDAAKETDMIVTVKEQKEFWEKWLNSLG